MSDRRARAVERPWVSFEPERRRAPDSEPLARQPAGQPARQPAGHATGQTIGHATGQLADSPTELPIGLEQSPHVLPPERPFAGDDRDTLELLASNAVRARRRRRRVRRVGIFVVVALSLAAVQPFVERMLGAW